MKKTVSLIIVISMMLCMLPIVGTTAFAQTTHIDLSGYADGATYKDQDGTEYEVIRTAANFKAIDRTKNCIFACSIDMNGEAFTNNIFGDGTSIQGIIDGNGYSLYNFSATYSGTYGSVGLLAQSLKGNASVRNLTIGTPEAPIEYKINGSSANVAGALVGKIHEDTTAEQTVTVSNVHIYCNMTFEKAISNGVSLGGFIGTTNTKSGGAAYNVNISDCSFTGSISFPESAAVSGKNTRVGGFVGYHQKGILTVTDCVNNANIDITKRTSDASASGYAYAGGIVGRADVQVTFTRCSNNGSMTSDRYSGGIAGHTDKLTTFDGCSNTGTIKANTYSGGITGRSFYSGTQYIDCTNSGNITATDKAGGIVGQTDNTVTFSGCSNTGIINATSYSGGIEGYIEGEASFTECFNNGAVTSGNYAGGILARANKKASFKDCVNSGDISSSVNAGGVLGGAHFSTTNEYVFTFEGCVNHGDIFALSSSTDTKTTAGGIIGVTNYGAYEISKCGNTGDLSASFIYDSTGVPKLGACGIIGRYYVDNSNTVITDCYSIGAIASSVENDTRSFTPYAICTGSVSNGNTVKLKATDCVWNMTFNNTAVTNGLPTTTLSADSGNNSQKNIIAKTSTKAYDAFAQKSIDNTKLRILLVSAAPELQEDEEIIINVYYGENQGKKLTVPANYIFALHRVEAAGEMYYAVGDAYIFGGVITGIPETVNITRVEVEYGEFSWEIPMEG